MRTPLIRAFHVVLWMFIIKRFHCTMELSIYLGKHELVVWRLYSRSIQHHFEDPEYHSYNLTKTNKQTNKQSMEVVIKAASAQ